MQRLRRPLGIAIALVGLVIAAYPFISVSRLQAQVLDEVPLPPGASVLIEGETKSPLSDDDFVLAFRGVDASMEAVEQTLIDAGFERRNAVLEGSPAWVRPCCGHYDAVMVAVFEGRDGVTGLRYSVIDDDIASTWWMLNAVGAIVVIAGLALVMRSARPASDSTTLVDSGQTPVSII